MKKDDLRKICEAEIQGWITSDLTDGEICFFFDEPVLRNTGMYWLTQLKDNNYLMLGFGGLVDKGQKKVATIYISRYKKLENSLRVFRDGSCIIKTQDFERHISIPRSLKKLYKGDEDIQYYFDIRGI